MKTFSARLSGSQEVPPVRTNANGRFFARLSRNGRRLRFILVVRDIRNTFAGHIHLGRRGVNGPIVAFLFGNLRNPVSVRRRVFTGTITRQDLTGPLKGRCLKALLRQMRQGNAYVNVHTTQNPNGEIRGQVRHRQ
jgi:hypothetical protein